MKSANRSGARFAVIAGERDLTEGVVQLKNLESGEQIPVALDTVVAELQAKLD
jgi:histidyl-tRNA synthetase